MPTAASSPHPDRISATTASTVDVVRDATTTCAPSRAYSSAIARPIPRPAPVTIATFPSSLPMSSPDLLDTCVRNVQPGTHESPVHVEADRMVHGRLE